MRRAARIRSSSRKLSRECGLIAAGVAAGASHAVVCQSAGLKRPRRAASTIHGVRPSYDALEKVMLSGSVRAAIVLTLLAGLTGCAADRKQRVAERKLHEAMEEYARANPHLIVRRVQWHTPIAVRRRSVARPVSRWCVPKESPPRRLSLMRGAWGTSPHGGPLPHRRGAGSWPWSWPCGRRQRRNGLPNSRRIIAIWPA